MKLYRMLVLLLCCCCAVVQAKETVDLKLKPEVVPDQPWQIGFYQGG